MGNKLFGTDGVRGVANVYPMTAEFALKLGMAAGQLICRKTRRAAVARDTRISGEMLEAALTAGFNAAGVTVLKLGVVPTPAATMLTPSLGVDMTVMITASHNPYQDNGIKLINADGDFPMRKRPGLKRRLWPTILNLILMKSAFQRRFPMLRPGMLTRH